MYVNNILILVFLLATAVLLPQRYENKESHLFVLLVCWVSYHVILCSGQFKGGYFYFPLSMKTSYFLFYWCESGGRTKSKELKRSIMFKTVVEEKQIT